MLKRSLPGLILIFLFYSIYYVYVLKVPPVWPDEALLADLSLNLLKEGRFGSDLLKNMVPGVEFFGFGYPPLFFFSLAGWFKVVGFSILSQRVLSLVAGTLFSLIFIQVVKLFIKPKNGIVDEKFPVMVLTLLFLDHSFQKATTMSRPEIVVLLLGFVAVIIYFKKIKYSYAISGLTLGLAFLFHYLAIIFILSFMVLFAYKYRMRVFTEKKVHYFLIGLTSPILFWLFSIYEHLQYQIQDFFLRFQYKSNAPNWISTVFSGQLIDLKLIYVLYISVLFLFFAKVLKSPILKNVFAFSLLIFSWIFSYTWQTEYSFIYVPVFSLFSLSCLIFSNVQELSLRKILKSWNTFASVAIFILILIISTYQFINRVAQLGGENYSYEQFDENISALIPDNVTVYVSSIPDPYYSLVKKNNLTIYQFPSLPTPRKLLLSVLDKSDYIIFNLPLETITIGEMIVAPYIQKNTEQVWKIGYYGQYETLVIKLAPRNQRLSIDK